MRIVCLLVGVCFWASFAVAGGEPGFDFEEEERAVSSHTRGSRVKCFRKKRKKPKSGKPTAKANVIRASGDEEKQRRDDQRQEFLGVGRLDLVQEDAEEATLHEQAAAEEAAKKAREAAEEAERVRLRNLTDAEFLDKLCPGVLALFKEDPLI